MQCLCNRRGLSMSMEYKIFLQVVLVDRGDHVDLSVVRYEWLCSS